MSWELTPRLLMAQPAATSIVHYPSVNSVGCSDTAPQPLSLWEDIFQQLPAGVLFINHNGVIEHCNDAAKSLLGINLYGRQWVDVINETIDQQQSNSGDVVLKNGSVINLSTNALRSTTGQLLVLNDVTETTRIKMQLSHLERLSGMGRIAAQLAHQIRTPLSAALLHAKNLATAIKLPDRQMRYVDKLVGSLKNMESQIKDMLLFAKDGHQNCFETTLLNEFLSEVERETAAAIHEHAAQFNIVQDGPPSQKITANTVALLGALTNCINNALEAGTEAVRITLTTEKCREGVLDIRIADDGPGVPFELIEKVKEPFFTTRQAGTGLGLAVADAVARNHDGEFWLDSPNQSGVIACFRLPILTE